MRLKLKILLNTIIAFIISPKIILLGDSLTLRGNWYLLLRSLRVYNSGLSGYTSKGVLDSLWKTVFRYKPTHCFIMCGVNDIMQGIGISFTLSNIQQIVQRLQEKKIIPILQAVILTENDEWNIKITELNKQLLDYSVKQNIDFNNMNLVLSKNGKLRDGFSLDGLHLTKPAYFFWAEEIRKILGKKNKPLPYFLSPKKPVVYQKPMKY